MEGTSLARRVYLWLAWLFLASVVLQVFFIGLQLFAEADSGLHMGFGYLVLLLSLVVVVASFIARMPGRSKQWAGGLFLVTLLQVILAGLRYSGLGLVAALHPLNAFVVFGVGVIVLRDAREQARMPAPSEAPPASESPAEVTSPSG